MEKRAILMIVAIALIITSGTWADVIYVDDDAPGGGDGTSWGMAYRFLQDALAEADSAEKPVEVHVAGGLYRPDQYDFAPDGTEDRDLYFHVVDGTSLLGGYAGLGASNPNARDIGAYGTILSGDLADNDTEVTDPTLLRDDPTREDNTRCPLVRLRGGGVRFEGFTVTGGTSGAVWVASPSSESSIDVTIADCVFYGNRGSEGDAPWPAVLEAYSVGSGVVVSRCSFIANAGSSGAISGRDIVIEHCQFTGNHAWEDWGGAGVLTEASLITDCTFVENSSAGDGGALYVRGLETNTTELLRCVFRDNTACKRGGAILCNGYVNLCGCLFVGNCAVAGGGAGFDYGYDTHLSNCILAGNQADECGGAWFTYAWSALTMVNCTAWANCAQKGTFLAVDYDTEKNSDVVEILNCVLSNGDDEIWTDASPVSVAYTCFGQGLGTLSDANDWITLGAGIIEADPCVIDPGYWDDNGTADDPSDDFFVEGDYHLKSQAGRWDPASESWVKDEVTSPCIDAGDPNSPIMYEPFPNGGIINMGAYGGTAEASKSYFGDAVCETIITGDINGDCKVDIEDLVLLISHWTETGDQTEE